MHTIERDALKRILDSGDSVYLVDALPADIYEQGHLPGAVNITTDNVHQLALTLLPDKQAPVVTYCGGPL
jgi:Rhodanese-related sulfurtransferase